MPRSEADDAHTVPGLPGSGGSSVSATARYVSRSAELRVTVMTRSPVGVPSAI